jgi:hypothetical protein
VSGPTASPAPVPAVGSVPITASDVGVWTLLRMAGIKDITTGAGPGRGRGAGRRVTCPLTMTPPTVTGSRSDPREEAP